MTFNTINVGQSPNDTTGDAIRTAFQKLNAGIGSLDSQAYFNARLVQSNLFLANTFTYNNAVLTGNVTSTGNLIVSRLIASSFNPANMVVSANVTTGNLIVPPGGFIYGTFAGTISSGDIESTNIGLITPAMGQFTSVAITDTTDTDDLATGALVVAGGAAVAANVRIGKDLIVTTGNAYFANARIHEVTGDVRLYSGTLYINDDPVITASSNFSGGNVANPTRFLSKVISTRANTGAVIVDGGAGIVGNLYVGGNVGITGNVSGKYGTFTGNLYVGPAANAAIFANGSISGSLTSGTQSGITGVGTLTGLNLGGDVTLAAGTTYKIGDVTTPLADLFSYRVNATQVTGTLFTAAQPNVTSLGTLSELAVTANVVAGNVQGTKGTFVQATGTLLTAAQPNITSLGTLTGLNATGDIITTGNVSGANILVSGGIVTGHNANIIMAAGTYIGTEPTGGVRVPYGSDGQRPASNDGNVGMIRLNTTSGMFEGFTGTEWVEFARKVSAVGGGTDKVFQENETIINTSYAITAGKSAMSVGPITMAAGVTVTIPAGKRWVIL